jgi:hypothetical protein
LTNCEQIVELAVDSTALKYTKTAIADKFCNADLPFTLENFDSSKTTDSMVNSEIKYESWYIENPVSKELTKRITLKLGPKAEQDFIVVVRAPSSKKSENLISIINLGLLTYADEQFGLRNSFEEFLKTRFAGSMKEFLKDRIKVA